ncbi:MAG: hypothetical protein H6642_11970 [Caldilineaceae bacterium]|nr:hypothetical protein [Caldilineaceae bacterium]MCB9139054.1 hypothetical protein [Caldilineaceae bacterium]
MLTINTHLLLDLHNQRLEEAAHRAPMTHAARSHARPFAELENAWQRYLRRLNRRLLDQRPRGTVQSSLS